MFPASLIAVMRPDFARTQEVFHDQLAPAPAFVLGWKMPPRRTPDFYALSLAADLLFEGDSSRLYQKLVKGDESVVSIQGGIDERRGPSALYIFALPKPGEEVATIRDQIFAEIQALRASGPSAEEMEKLRNSLCNDVVRGRQSTMYRAQRLAEYTLYDNDPTLMDSELDQYLSITPEQIRSSVERFLDIDNRVVLDIEPATLGEQPPAEPPASELPPGEPQQPAAPASQVPAQPPTQPTMNGGGVVAETENRTEQPADPSQQIERGSGPLHT